MELELSKTRGGRKKDSDKTDHSEPVPVTEPLEAPVPQVTDQEPQRSCICGEVDNSILFLFF
jgi:hypothetical protein